MSGTGCPGCRKNARAFPPCMPNVFCSVPWMSAAGSSAISTSPSFPRRMLTLSDFGKKPSASAVTVHSPSAMSFHSAAPTASFFRS